MPKKDIVVIGASAGGVEACRKVVSELSPDFSGSIFIVIHLPGNAVSVLPQIFSDSGPLPAIHPADGEIVKPGYIYVAPPDHHMLLKQGYIRLVAGPEENYSRPAIDPLFRTAAAAYGDRVVGVILSGNLDDGTAGLKFLKMHGGTAIVQDPDNATFPGMPKSAIQNVETDHVQPLDRISALIDSIARTEAVNGNPGPKEGYVDILEMPLDDLQAMYQSGTSTSFACPRCGGMLRERVNGDSSDFRCRVGHAFSARHLESALSDSLEAALWNAVKVLEEKEQLSLRLADRMEALRVLRSADHFRRVGEKATDDANIIRGIILRRQVRAEGESS